VDDKFHVLVALTHNSVALVREQTTPTELLPSLGGEVSANLSG
jgi:hypothetical protein